MEKTKDKLYLVKGYRNGTADIGGVGPGYEVKEFLIAKDKKGAGKTFKKEHYINHYSGAQEIKVPNGMTLRGYKKCLEEVLELY